MDLPPPPPSSASGGSSGKTFISRRVVFFSDDLTVSPNAPMRKPLVKKELPLTVPFGQTLQIMAMVPASRSVGFDFHGDVFSEDFKGLNGRSKKTLFLSEIAMASEELDKILPFVDGLMSPKTGLNNRIEFGYVELFRCHGDL